MVLEQLVSEARRHPERFPKKRRKQWAAGQSPIALFIACSDSRVIPALITGAEPGQLFELRTAGNVVPEYTPQRVSSEMATIEYGVLQLDVPNIIVCGHSHCGAVTATATAGYGTEALPALRNWLGIGESAFLTPAQDGWDPAVRAESQQHVVAQLRTLYEYPFIRERVALGELRLHTWFYEIDTGQVWAHSPSAGGPGFRPL